MKLGPDVLIEIMSIVHYGLLNQTDVSQRLRDLDLVEVEDKLVLSEEYRQVYSEELC